MESYGTTVATYTSTQGSSQPPPGFAHPVINLNAYINCATLQIRFHYHAQAMARYWAIDNVTVSGTSPSATISWTSVPPGFTSNVANPPPVTQYVTTTYTVTYTDPNTTCSGSASVTVNMNPVPTPTITANYCAVPGFIQLTAHPTTGVTYLWSTGQTINPILVNLAAQYSVIVTNAFVCSATAILPVAMNLLLMVIFLQEM